MESKTIDLVTSSAINYLNGYISDDMFASQLEDILSNCDDEMLNRIANLATTYDIERTDKMFDILESVIRKIK